MESNSLAINEFEMGDIVYDSSYVSNGKEQDARSETLTRILCSTARDVTG